LENAAGKVLIYWNFSIIKPANFPATVTIIYKEVIIDRDELVLNRTYFNIKYTSKSIFSDLKEKFIHDEIEIQVKAKLHDNFFLFLSL